MTIRRITRKALKVLNGINTFEVPAGTHVIGVQAFNNEPDPVQLMLVEEVQAVGSELREPETISVVVTTDNSPFSDPPEGQALQYIGTVLWDNGYRVNHVFEIETIPAFDEIPAFQLPLGDSPESIVFDTKTETIANDAEYYNVDAESGGK